MKTKTNQKELDKLNFEIKELIRIKKILPKFIKDDLIDTIDEQIDVRKVTKVQLKCKHENVTGMICTGHDSHYNTYENTCNDCGYVLEYDDRR